MAKSETIVSPPKKQAIIYVGYYKSGKDTQTEPLERLGEKVLVTGRHLKELAKKSPDDLRYEPINQGKLVNDSTTVWATKMWIFQMIMNFPGHTRLHFNGVPRRVGQIEVIPFLVSRRYKIKCVQFTTPPEVCDKRVREGRFEDKKPDVLKNRADVYTHETVPMIEVFGRYGISEEAGTLLKIDNTHLSPRQTAEQIIRFVGLPYSPSEMFPDESEDKLVCPSITKGATASVSA